MRHQPAIRTDSHASSAQDLLRDAILNWFPGRIALVSSFGAESVVLLHMVAEIDPATPVLFGDTGRLFPETHAYQREVALKLGLRNQHFMRPDRADILAEDPDGDLAQRDGPRCCEIRKVVPLKKALAPFSAWITGRKRAQTAMRAAMGVIEADEDQRVKVNPLADWTSQDVQDYMDTHDLPRHPLVAKGYASIGCAPCTQPVRPGEDPRAGRWRGEDRQECGIHFVNGRPVRGAAIS